MMMGVVRFVPDGDYSAEWNRAPLDDYHGRRLADGVGCGVNANYGDGLTGNSMGDGWGVEDEPL